MFFSFRRNMATDSSPVFFEAHLCTRSTRAKARRSTAVEMRKAEIFSLEKSDFTTRRMRKPQAQKMETRLPKN